MMERIRKYCVRRSVIDKPSDELIEILSVLISKLIFVGYEVNYLKKFIKFDSLDQMLWGWDFPQMLIELAILKYNCLSCKVKDSDLDVYVVSFSKFYSLCI